MNFIGKIETPAFVLDHARLVGNVLRFQRFATDSRGRVLFSLKSLGLRDALVSIASSLDGFSASSLFEARLAREIGGDKILVNYISPILRECDLKELVSTCNHVTLNSLSQLDRFASRLSQHCDVGIRLNPGISFVNDSRYDPCAPKSRLGVPLDGFSDALRAEPYRFANVAGIHFHSNCDSDDLGQLLTTIRRVETVLGEHFHCFRWLNVGGGYLFRGQEGVDALATEFLRLSHRYGLEMVIEPGAGIARSAGCFVSTVEDIVEGDEHPVAILDMTVNHWPEVFEYQFEPDVVGHVEDGRYTYLLAGCSCLAGDLFGTYSFAEPLKVGSKIVFENAGAYSIVKAHMFNGINLPNIYALTARGELVLIKSFTYEDFASRWGVDTRAIV